ncbi:MAG: aromatic amino acid ammonia-lyase, partial [Desulfovibrionales bacterium]|nr:aromatic amino acid ammonia-lyase [Desulfovibrionales bacterium]
MTDVSATPLGELRDPSKISQVVMGSPMGIEEVVAVARHNARVEFSPAYVERVEKCRDIVEEISRQEAAVYGITTGLGENWKRKISLEDRQTVQANNIRSHACSLGEPLGIEAVRAMMFVMLQHLGSGHTGICLKTLEIIQAMLNKGVTPHVPANGSVGYLCLEAHMGLVMMGEGKAYVDNELYPGKEALERAGIAPIQFSSKEGLSLTSGTTSVTALASLGLYDALVIAKTADIVGAMSLEVLKGTLMAMDPRIMDLRPHRDQSNSAANVRAILEKSEITAHYRGHRVQDSLALRCIPQLHGAGKKTLKDSWETLVVELNASVDNPLIFKEEDQGFALMGCNADGTYVGLASDVSAIALANLVKMSERRLDRLVNPHISDLPPFLNGNPGLNNGLMIPQYAAAGIMGQIKILCHPATVDNFVTCANQEDYVSMGYNGAKKLYEVSQLARYILATELFNACQAQDFYTDLAPAPATARVKNKVRTFVPFVEQDCDMSIFIEALSRCIMDQGIIQEVEAE